jgi:predicted transcriptional regulator
MQASMTQGQGLATSGPTFQVHWKKDKVISTDPEAPLWEAVQLMKQNHVGDVLVIDSSLESGQPVGVITDRDIALCLSEHVDFKNLRVMDVMSKSVVTGSVNDDLFKIIRTMKDSGVTRLPLTDAQGNIAGVVTAKNILQILAGCFFDVTQISEQQQENEEFQKH